MSVDPSVTAALEAAVAAEPANAALRVHLAGLLVVGGDAARGLEHAQAALAVSPDDTAALATARDAAQALGDHDRARGYERLLGLGPVAAPLARAPRPSWSPRSSRRSSPRPQAQG